jgi:phage-related protein
MPQTSVVFYREADGSVPVLDWLLTDVLTRDKKLFAWCFDGIEQLSLFGRDLRRPVAEYLRDGIFELRIRYYRQNYRILYFYHEGEAAVLSHGLAKEAKVPDKDIDLAVQRKTDFEANPEAHTYYED